MLNRLPASFFVSVAYDCWAFRRLGVVLDAKTGEIKRWLYRDDKQPAITMSQGSGFVTTGKEKVLRTPLTEEQVRTLEVGDVVLITGEMYTGRDAVHAHLMKHDPPTMHELTATRIAGPYGKQRFEAVLLDHTGRLDLVWFNMGFLQNQIYPGVRLRVHGKAKRRGPGFQLANPRHQVLKEGSDEPEAAGERLRPVYPAAVVAGAAHA